MSNSYTPPCRTCVWADYFAEYNTWECLWIHGVSPFLMPDVIDEPYSEAGYCKAYERNPNEAA